MRMKRYGEKYFLYDSPKEKSCFFGSALTLALIFVCGAFILQAVESMVLIIITMLKAHSLKNIEKIHFFNAAYGVIATAAGILLIKLHTEYSKKKARIMGDTTPYIVFDFADNVFIFRDMTPIPFARIYACDVRDNVMSLATSDHIATCSFYFDNEFDLFTIANKLKQLALQAVI